MSLNTKILIVEDEILIADFIADFLKMKGFSDIEMAHKPEVAVKFFKALSPKLY